MRRILATLALLAGAIPAVAQDVSTGVPVCDTFVTNYQACVSTRVPEAQRQMFASQITQMRATWRELAQTQEGRTHLEAACRQQADQMRQGLAQLGCQF